MPVDPRHPEDIIIDMLQASNVCTVIFDQVELSMVKRIQHATKNDIPWFEFKNIEQQILASNYWEVTEDTDPVYIYFTSGSQGKPKGIIGQTKGLAHFITWEASEFNINQSVRVAQLTPPYHDPFLRDILLPLYTGGTICIPPSREFLLHSQEMAAWLKKEKITLIHCTPSMFSIFASEAKTPDDFPCLRYIFLAGEPVVPNLITGWFKMFSSHIQFINLYGPTETTLAKIFHRIVSDDLKRKTIPVGICLPGTRMLVVDEEGKICKRNHPGEVWIRTPYRSLGYLDKVLTAQKFIKNPFSALEDDIIYKTGDLGRILDNGDLDLIGRIDRQIKIRGHRVELVEIENALHGHEAVKQAAVIYNEAAGILYAFVQLSTESINIKKPDILTFLGKKLPEYMIPGVLEFVSVIPMNDNAKIDYKQLFSQIAIQKKSWIAPSTQIECSLTEICMSIFKINQISMSDTLFMLGASSVNIMRFVTTVNTNLRTNLTLADVYENRGLTLGELASMIESRQADQKAPVSIIPEPFAKKYVVAPAQKRIFILQSLDQDSTIYNITRAVVITGGITNQKLEQEMTRLIHRHEIFRTSFFMDDGVIFQSVNDKVNFKFEFMTCETDDGLFNAIQVFQKPFILTEAPLIRTCIIELPTGKRVLVFDVHHIIIDGRSLDRAISEFCLSVAGIDIEPETVTYKDYTLWKYKTITADRLNSIEQYWKQRLGSSLPVLEICCSRKRPLAFTYNGSRCCGKINAELRKKVGQTAQKCNTTEFIILLAAYFILLQKYSKQNDIVVGTVANGRYMPEIQNTLGMFVNTIPLRTSIDTTLVAEQFIIQLHDCVYKDLKHQDLSFESIVELIDIVRDPSRNPIFDTMFVYQEESQQHIDIEETSFELLDIPNATTKYDLTLELTPVEDYYSYTIEYCTDLFESAAIQHMMIHYLTLLEELCSKTSFLLGNLSCVAEQEHQLLLTCSQGKESLKTTFSSVVDHFGDIVCKFSSQTAVVEGEKTITYSDLDKSSDELAAIIYARGVRKGDFVGIIAAHSTEMIVAAIAVLKCGAAYVPIDSQLPTDRINYLLSDCCAKMLLSDSLPSSTDYLLDAENIGNLLIMPKKKPVPTQVDLENSPAYVIYTSGSTGKPKGVIITHLNMLTYIEALKFYYIDRNPFTMTQLASFSFDVSVEEIFGTLLNGGKLILVEKEQMLNLDVFNCILTDHQVDYISTSPSFAGLLNRYNGLYSVSSMIVGGEVVNPHQVNELAKHIRVINSYGPTETCIGATFCQYNPLTHKERIPIGTPLPGYNVYVLNHQDQLCGFNIPGEICISGKSVSPGYTNAELNKNHFLADPFSQTRMYRSGDEGFMREDGNIEFIARLDDQIKLRGYRIERDEIVHTALSTGLVQDFIVGLYKISNGATALCGAYIAEYNVSDQLKKSMAKIIPGYMIPEILVRIEAFPVTANGKIDKDVLADIFICENTVNNFRMPSTDSEHRLARIWESTLGKNAVPVNMSFWELGGNSISAVSMILTAVNHGYQVNINDIFSNMTIEEIAAKHSNTTIKLTSLEDSFLELKKQTGITVKIIPDGDNNSTLQIDTKYSLNHEEAIYNVLNKSVISNKIKNIVWQDEKEKTAEDSAIQFSIHSNGFSFQCVSREDHPITPSQYYYIMMDEQYCMDTISIDGFFSKKQFCIAVNQLINSQQMLRAGYRKSEILSAKVVFYEPEDNLTIPYVDLLSLSSDEKTKRLKHLDILLCKTKPDKSLPYRMVIIRTELNRHSLRLYIHHAFYDLFSGTAIKASLEQFLNGQKPHIKEISQKNQLISVDAEELIRIFNLNEFYDRSNALDAGSRRLEKGHIRFTRKYPLISSQTETMIITTAVQHIGAFFSNLYNIEKLPFWMIYHGRDLSVEADYSFVGSFIDVIPFLWDSMSADCFTDELHEKIIALKKGNISFGRILLNREPTLTGTPLVRQLRRLIMKQFIAINFQGKEHYSAENTIIEPPQKINMKKNIAIVTYSDTDLNITFDLPIADCIETRSLIQRIHE